MSIIQKLTDNGYVDVYTDKREEIEFELRQEKLRVERATKQRALEENGWVYRVMSKENVEDPEDV